VPHGDQSDLSNQTKKIKMDFELIVEKAIEKGMGNALALDRVETLAFARFQGTFIDVPTMAKIHKVSEQTVRAYIKLGLIETEPRETDKSEFRIELSHALKLKFSELKKKAKHPSNLFH
jgi:hypothetical protein